VALDDELAAAQAQLARQTQRQLAADASAEADHKQLRVPREETPAARCPGVRCRLHKPGVVELRRQAAQLEQSAAAALSGRSTRAGARHSRVSKPSGRALDARRQGAEEGHAAAARAAADEAGDAARVSRIKRSSSSRRKSQSWCCGPDKTWPRRARRQRARLGPRRLRGQLRRVASSSAPKGAWPRPTRRARAWRLSGKSCNSRPRARARAAG
jgi:hypothetical protein